MVEQSTTKETSKLRGTTQHHCFLQNQHDIVLALGIDPLSGHGYTNCLNTCYWGCIRRLWTYVVSCVRNSLPVTYIHIYIYYRNVLLPYSYVAYTLTRSSEFIAGALGTVTAELVYVVQRQTRSRRGQGVAEATNRNKLQHLGPPPGAINVAKRGGQCCCKGEERSAVDVEEVVTDGAISIRRSNGCGGECGKRGMRYVFDGNWESIGVIVRDSGKMGHRKEGGKLIGNVIQQTRRAMPVWGEIQ